MNSAQFSQRVQTQEQKEGELCSIKIENNSDEQKEEELSQKLIDHHPKEEKRKNSAQNSETNKNPRSSIDPKIRTLPYRLTSSRAKLWAKLHNDYHENDDVSGENENETSALSILDDSNHLIKKIIKNIYETSNFLAFAQTSLIKSVPIILLWMKLLRRSITSNITMYSLERLTLFNQGESPSTLYAQRSGRFNRGHISLPFTTFNFDFF